MKARSTKFGSRWLGVPLILAACGDDFVSESRPTVSVQPNAAFPDTMPRTERASLSVKVADQSMRELVGTRVEWSSSDERVIQLIPGVPPVSGSALDSVAAGLRATALARGLGSAFVRVAITAASGAANRVEYQRTITVTEPWIAVSAAPRHTCAINVDSTAYCWGGPGGRLGDGSLGGSPTPVRVNGLAGLRLVEISAGEGVTCARAKGGQLYCWGLNEYGEVGNGSVEPQLTAALGGGGATYGSVSVGGQHTCATSASSQVMCWGETELGQLGDGRTSATVDCGFFVEISFRIGTRRCTPGPDQVVQLGGVSSVHGVSLSSGGFHTCVVNTLLVVDTTGGVLCWGLVTVGQIGNSQPDPPGFAICTGGSEFTYLFSLPCFVYAIFVDGSPLPEFRSVSAGWDLCDNAFSCRFGGYRFQAHSCAIAVDSATYCWGSNDHGQLGTPISDPAVCAWDAPSTDDGTGGDPPIGSAPCRRNPTAIATPHSFVTIGAGARHTCAVGASDSLVYCWGDNSAGQLGNGSIGGAQAEPRPVATTPPGRFIMLSVGGEHSCGIVRPAAAIYCWGEGDDGRLGTGELGDRPAPVRVAEPAS
jgi:alpha-tubulin suppressor-like RCC1 family protein